jgi:hypothetical protein
MGATGEPRLPPWAIDDDDARFRPMPGGMRPGLVPLNCGLVQIWTRFVW